MLISPCRAEQEASAIKGKKGYIELRNQTNGMYFTTKTLKALNEEKIVLKKEYDKKQSTLVKEVITIAGGCKKLCSRTVSDIPDSVVCLQPRTAKSSRPSTPSSQTST